MSETKWKGAVGLAKAICAFTELNIPVFQAIGYEHLPYDLVIAVGDTFQRVQVKYRESKRNGSIMLSPSTSWSNRSGTHSRKYATGDFDVFALYVADIDRMLFFPFEMLGKTVSLKPRKTADFHWWEDYTVFPPAIPAKQSKQPTGRKRLVAPRQSKRAESQAVVRATPKPRKTKIAWPDSEALKTLVQNTPTAVVAEQLGVSDNAVRKRCLRLGIVLKPRGYWAKVSANKASG